MRFGKAPFRLALIAVFASTAVEAKTDELSVPVRRAIGQDFGVCIAQKNVIKSRAIEFVINANAQDGAKIARDECFLSALHKNKIWWDSATGRWPVETFRVFVANGLVRTDFAASGPSDFDAVPALNHGFMAEVGTSPLDLQTELALGMDKLGECAARKDPEAVRRLALTAISSTEELNMLRSLAPTFGRCLPQGVAVQYPRDMLRDKSVLAYARLVYTANRSALGLASAAK